MKAYIDSNLRKWGAILMSVSCALVAVSSYAATLYVATNSPADGPGTGWTNAFHTIQGAVNAAASGDTVLVTNGVYATGGAVTPGYALTNRVCITSAIKLQSVNGPASTCIVGASDHGTNGPAAVRCVYLNANALVSGFTLTNGNTRVSGHVILDQCGGGAFLHNSGTLSNCVLSGCSAYNYGGGAHCSSGGTLNNCTLSGNSVTGSGGGGGGACCYGAGGTLNNCTITGNQAHYWGGGVECLNGGGTLNNCTISGNLAVWGDGGGAFLWSGGTLNNCVLSGNSATHGSDGGGAYFNDSGGLLNNCTLSGNSASRGGGAYCYSGGTLVNCIVSGNSPGGAQNIEGSSTYTVQYSCSPGLSGSGNLTNDPQFVDAPAGNYRLATTSPCINVGTNQAWMTGKTDLDGNPRIIAATVDLGAYEYVSYEILYVATNGGNVWPYATWANAATTIQAAVDAVATGGMVLVSNGVYAAGGAATPGYALPNRVSITKAITLQSVNGPSNTLIVGSSDHGTNGPAATRCVYLNGGATLSGFTLTNGYTLAAGDWGYEVCAGGLWLNAGTTASNCVITGCSAAAHGGGLTFDSGGTVTDSRIEQCSSSQGGGIFMNHGGLLDRCTVSKNQGTTGGGFYCYYGGDVRNSLITGNTAVGGGGASCDHGGTFENCTVTGNSCTNSGGGMNFYYGGTNVNCIVYFNLAGTSGSNWSANAGTFQFTCTTPTNGLNAYGGTGCITNNPLFVNFAAGDYQLQAGSPCINAGNNAYAQGATGLDENPRIIGGVVDLGAYESTKGATTNGIPWGWLVQYGLATDGSADMLNADGDGCNNWQEYRADTNPTNAASYFHITAISNLPPLTVTFLSSSNRVYSLRCATNLDAAPWTVIPGQSNVAGTGAGMSLADTNPAPPVRFYRVKVALP